MFTKEHNLNDFVNHKSEKVNLKQLSNMRKYNLDEFLITMNKYTNKSSSRFLKSILNLNTEPELNDFNKLKILAVGGFGKVYLTERDSNLFAIKEIKKKDVIVKDCVDYLKNEFKLLKESNHPFIINLTNIFQNTSRIYFVMPFIQGGDLKNYIKNNYKSINEEIIKFFIAQIILALKYLYEKGIVYQDLKPENILVECDGYIKICDFGTIRYLSEIDEGYDNYMGTYYYLSPEILNRKKYNHCVDIWSLGIICLYFILGKNPFHNLNKRQIMSLILKENFYRDKIKNANISNNFKNFIENCLQYNYLDRFNNGDYNVIMNHRWFNNINFDKLLNKKYDFNIKLNTISDDLIKRSSYKNSIIIRNNRRKKY